MFAGAFVVMSDLNIDWLVHRLMSDNPLRPYIGRIIAMWQDKAGLHPLVRTVAMFDVMSRLMLDPCQVVL